MKELPAGSPLATGREISRHAHRLFPGGALVDEEPWQHAQAVARTAAALDGSGLPILVYSGYEQTQLKALALYLELCWNLGDAVIRRRVVLACW